MTYTFDPLKLIVAWLIILMMLGVIGFTPVSVGALLLSSMFELKFSWVR